MIGINWIFCRLELRKVERHSKELMHYLNRQGYSSCTYILRSWGSFLKIPVASRTENSLLFSLLKEITSISEKNYSVIDTECSTLSELFILASLNIWYLTGSWRAIPYIVTFLILIIPVNEHSHSCEWTFSLVLRHT